MGGEQKSNHTIIGGKKPPCSALASEK